MGWRGFGVVYRSRTLFCRAVPTLSITIRNFFHHRKVVLLDVAGMSCGGCSAAVKRILEHQPRVAFANVNLSAETARASPLCR